MIYLSKAILAISKFVQIQREYDADIRQRDEEHKRKDDELRQKIKIRITHTNTKNGKKQKDQVIQKNLAFEKFFGKQKDAM